jgi:hypothetical protein
MLQFHLRTFVTIVTGSAFIILGTAIIAAAYNLNKGKAYLAYPVITTGVQDNVQAAIANVISPMVAATLAVMQTNQELLFCSMPLYSKDFYSVFNYSPLIGLMNSYGYQNNTAMQSIGIIAVNGSGSATPQFGNKISCEIAINDFNLNCSDYIYACTDDTYNFEGFCAYPDNTVDLSTIVYSEPDTGLVAAEIELFTNNNIRAIFLPIFNLLGQFSLTYERSYWCSGDKTAYASTLAEKSLTELNDYLSTLTIGKTGVAYIVEQATGLLISTSLPTQALINSTGARLAAVDADNFLIKKSANYLVSKATSYTAYTSVAYVDEGNILIDIQPVEYAPAEATLGWLSIVAIPKSDYDGWVSRNAGWSILVAVICIILILSIVIALFQCVVVKPLENKNYKTSIIEIDRYRESTLTNL